jgi:hypothetical protein
MTANVVDVGNVMSAEIKIAINYHCNLDSVETTRFFLYIA